ncbi:MAG: hypothetical protein JXM79_01215 [Sedimentisphaerales bacterium]|nr:hypothetical protein [Sedimentisphaerales bacterium]
MFAIIALVAAVLMAVLLYTFKGLGMQWGAVIISLGATIVLSSLVSSRFTRVIYLGFIFAALPIGLVVSFVLLAVFYFGILTPLAFIFRLIGRDTLQRTFDPGADSYWITHRKPDHLDRYYNQF